MKNRAWIFIAIGFFLVQGCATPKIQMFTDSSDPYKEFTLEGTQTPKVLVIQANGQIDEGPSRGLLRDRPGMVPDIVSQLRLAEKDKDIGAVVIKINSPGGSVTASDVLYHELKTFKEKTGVKMVAVFMGIAASGGYYIALPADRIVAHPTTITGSVGVIFLQPKVEGLMEKLGVGVDVSKSGDKKDMGSPFRASTAEETRLLQDLTDQLGRRFMDLLTRHRQVSPEALAEIRTARIFLADEARQLGLVDRIGYVEDAIQSAKTLAGLPDDAKVVVYRRGKFPDDTVYNAAGTTTGTAKPELVHIELPGSVGELSSGFFYIWPPAAGL
jgi:protease-4